MMIIAISGIPGTGKTLIAKKLADGIDFKYISLNDIAEKFDLYTGFDKERNTKIVDTGKINEKITAMGSKNIIIESHYAHDIESDILIILRCDIKELKKRLLKRKWSPKKIEENIEAEIMEIIPEEARKTGKKFNIIDNTYKTEETLEKIKKILKRY